MANLNKVMLIGRLTRDPEVRAFPSGGKVAKFGFAVNFSPRKKNQATGQWEGESVFIDIEAFNRESGRQLADLVEQYLRKGQQVYIEGRLRLNEWVDKKDNQKRSKLLVVADGIEFLEPRAEGTGEGQFSRSSAPARKPTAPAPSHEGFDEPEPLEPQGPAGEDPIPF
jgi:single-strand DNA-binding protein